MQSISSTCPFIESSVHSYPVLELGQVNGAEGISLGNNRNEVDTSAKTLHDLNVERLEGVAGGTDEVKAGVNAEVNLLSTARLLLLEHVRLVLVVEEFNDGLPRIAVVDVVTKARRVNDSQAHCGRLLASCA